MLNTLLATATRPKLFQHIAQVVLRCRPVLWRTISQCEAESSTAKLLGLAQLLVSQHRIDYFATLNKEPRKIVPRLRPETALFENLPIFCFSSIELKLSF